VKILKNIFGSKPKQTTKYEPNTLAEMNGSPDLRLATAKEKEVDIPLPKTDEDKKSPKASSKTSKTKSKETAKKLAVVKNQGAIDTASNGTEQKITEKKQSSAPTATKQSTVKKTSSSNKSSIKESTMKTVTKKEKEIKKPATTTKKADQKDKTTSGEIIKKSTAKVASTTASDTKKVAKPATKTDKKAAPSEQKASVPAAKAPTSTQNSNTTEKKAAPAAKKSSTATKNTTAAKSASPAKETKAAKKPTVKKEAESKDIDIITESRTTRSGKFEIKKSKDGRFVFNLYASNNMIVATSQVYSSSTSAMNGIKSVIANASSAPIEDQSLKKVTPVPFPKWEIYLDKGEQYRFRLCASNGSCVCHSQGYTSKANCKKGIESIIKFASDAEITKVYLEKKEK